MERPGGRTVGGDTVTHTPGPWIITERSGFSHDNRPRFLIAAPDEPERICTVSLRGSPNGDSEISLANARLIAAAPELLEACNNLLSLVRKLKPMPEVYNPQDEDEEMWGIGMLCAQADVAIAAAKGES